jgi:ArsR family transcriptional regulator, arsenate/arsenite/antimonite-responsive transcriptional repressor
MGASKADLFSPAQNQAADLCRALGHPARIAILQHLLKVRGCVCGDIVDALPLSQATISQHLKALRDVGLIDGEVEGVKVCYCINQKAWAETKALLEGFFADPASCC